MNTEIVARPTFGVRELLGREICQLEQRYGGRERGAHLRELEYGSVGELYIDVVESRSEDVYEDLGRTELVGRSDVDEGESRGEGRLGVSPRLELHPAVLSEKSCKQSGAGERESERGELDARAGLPLPLCAS